LPDASHIPFETITLGSVVSGGGALGVFALFLRYIGPWRKQRDEAEEKLRMTLTKRVAMLEKRIEIKDAKHEAERSLDRHKIRNLVQCLDAVLLVLEKAPDKAPEVVAEIRAMRQKQIVEENAEAAVIRAAEIQATARMTAEEDHDDA